MRLALPLLGLFALIACDRPPEGTTPTPASPSTTATTDQPDWRAGDSLIAVMNGIPGKVVADLFAGDGYYTWKLLDAGARVIAIDDDPQNISALEAQKRERGIGDDRLIIRATQPGVPGLGPNEADYALCTRRFTSIADPKAFFTQVRQGLRAPRPVYIVDFLPEQTPVGPPLDQRVGHEQVIDAMEQCGFTDVGAYWKKIPYRYIVFALAPDLDTAVQ